MQTVRSRRVLGAVLALFMTASASAQSSRPAAVQSPRVYVLDGGVLASETARYRLTDADVQEVPISVASFLIVHPRGVLLWDAGAVADHDDGPLDLALGGGAKDFAGKNFLQAGSTGTLATKAALEEASSFQERRIVGIFGIAEILRNLENEQERTALVTKITGLMPTKEDLKRIVAPVLRGTTLGSVLGVLQQAGWSLLWIVPFHVLPLWLDTIAWRILLAPRDPQVKAVYLGEDAHV